VGRYSLRQYKDGKGEGMKGALSLLRRIVSNPGQVRVIKSNGILGPEVSSVVRGGASLEEKKKEKKRKKVTAISPKKGFTHHWKDLGAHHRGILRGRLGKGGVFKIPLSDV